MQHTLKEVSASFQCRLHEFSTVREYDSLFKYLLEARNRNESEREVIRHSPMKVNVININDKEQEKLMNVSAFLNAYTRHF